MTIKIDRWWPPANALLAAVVLMLAPHAAFAQGRRATIIDPPIAADPRPQFLPRAPPGDEQQDLPSIDALQRQQFTLAPGAGRTFPVDVTRDSVLAARITAVGRDSSLASLQLLPGVPNQRPVTGKAVRDGVATMNSVQARAVRGTHPAVSVTNHGGAPVDVELVLTLMSAPH